MFTSTKLTLTKSDYKKKIYTAILNNTILNNTNMLKIQYLNVIEYDVKYILFLFILTFTIDICLNKNY